MKIAIILIVVITFAFFLLKPYYKFTYYYDSTKKNVLTRIEYSQLFNKPRTFFTLGHYNENRIPTSWIEPHYLRGWNDGFLLLLEWKSDVCYIYSLNYKCEYNNPVGNLKFVQVKGDEQQRLWNNLYSRRDVIKIR